jgi:hypothetical protein
LRATTRITVIFPQLSAERLTPNGPGVAGAWGWRPSR